MFNILSVEADSVAESAAIAINSNIDFGNVAIYAIITFVLIICSGMASGSEVAFFSLTHNDIDELEEKNSASSRRVLELLENPDRLLATILVANNMVNICLVIFATYIVDEIFIFSGVWEFIFNTVVITFILLLFGEIMPKVLSQNNPVKMSQMLL